MCHLLVEFSLTSGLKYKKKNEWRLLIGPCSPPSTTTGAFEVIGSRMEERTVTVRWSRLPLQCENGPGASYSVVLHDAGGNAM